MENVFFSDEERIEHIRQVLIAVATGTRITPELNRSYTTIRKDLLNSKYSNVLPLSIRSNFDLSQFWSFIKDKSSTYQGRRDILNNEFQAILDNNQPNINSDLYHIRIIKKGLPISSSLFSTNLNSFELEKFIKAYHYGEPIFIEGRTIPPDEIERFNIATSQLNFSVYEAQVKLEENSNSNPEDGLFISFSNTKSKAFNRLEDVTNQFIKFPLGYLRENSSMPEKMLNNSIKPKVNLKKVFIVHGRDEALIHEVQNFLYKLSLEGIVLNQQLNQGRTIIQKLLDLASDPEVGFGIVLYTPDDLGQISQELESSSEMTARARQNVIFEHGLLVGILGMNRVVALKKSNQNLEMPNDLSGVIYEQYDSAGGWKYRIAKEMIAQGYDLSLEKL
ncbi:nucleotide-binding protein [Acinetobacter baumannii]|nr:nucleotide-binding protein [Acinetobacter baumannii]